MIERCRFEEGTMDSPADNYWPEPCAYCSGSGKIRFNLQKLSPAFRRIVEKYYNEHHTPPCLVCGGKAFVLVLQPAQKCRQCEGTGRLLQVHCQYCKGTGWMFVRNEGVGFLK